MGAGWASGVDEMQKGRRSEEFCQGPICPPEVRDTSSTRPIARQCSSSPGRTDVGVGEAAQNGVPG
jgi:hypothetical protein